ncbi:T9SS type B sorting domain-containing protein [Flavobacterium facile]|uniref:T9SS type B sorting domain-containing protein n=1 Tax=Flavobacterium facile TaxID=2893174 RepID=UPI002E78F06A|nr:T9SS type B sorting domain-containing protein [Flavobacterium sp. T-12]
MKFLNRLSIIVSLFTLSVFSQQGAPSCAVLEANASIYQTCASNISFTSSTTASTEGFSPQCFGGQPLAGPSWFIFTILNPGQIGLQISQTNASGTGLDVDFALYGPFSTTNNLCSNINNATLVDCSYSTAALENVSVPNSNTGDIYVLVIDNFAARLGQSGPITVSQISGSGSTNCDFLSSVKLKNTDNSDITVFNYCKPETKEIVATIDVTAFSGSPANLRFNYTWYKDNIQIGTPVLNSTQPTNSIITTETGVYKVVITAYDIVINPNQNNPVPTSSEARVDFKFHTAPNVTLSNSNTVCLNSNPVLSATINNASLMNNSIDVLTYNWYRNNTLITGATLQNFTPTLPGNYFVKVFNAPCSSIDSNSINIVANPNVTISANQTICEGTNYTIVSSNANSTLNSVVTYEWFKDGISTGITTPNYVVNSSNQALNSTSTYYVVTTEQAICSQISNNVNITLNALPIVKTMPITLEQCDYVNNTLDGIAETNLNQVYNSLTFSTTGLTLYFYSDAALTNLIPNPNNYINSASPFTQTIYVKAINENVVPNCPSLGTGVVNLIINPTSVANYPDILAVCPELNNNYGFIDFNSQRILIKNTYFPSSVVAISFHLNTSDASTGLNELTNTSQLPIGTTLIYTRVISTTTNKCEGIGTFNVNVKTPPIQSSISNKNICLLDVYFLNSNESEALFGQNATVIATYFASYENARDNVAVINKSIPLPLVLGTRTYFVRLFDTVTQCFSIVSFNINVYPNPTIVQPNPIKHCGSLTAMFDLDSRINQITNGNTNYQVTFYASNADLLAGNNIVNSSSYNSGTTTLIVKVVDLINNNCASYSTLDLVVLSLPGAISNPAPIQLCNDSGFDYFDLKTKETEMSGGMLASSINFKYYINESDALLNNSNTILNPSSFRNTVIDYQKIYVRLNSTTNIDSETNLACFRILELELYVRPFPVNNLLNRPYTICVDQLNGIVYPVEVKTLLDNASYSFVWYNNFNAIPGNEIASASNNSYFTDIVGEYSVKITNTSNPAMCSSVFNFTTQNSLIPNTITPNPTELIAFEIDNTITVNATPISPDYLYSIDGNYWQESNVFTNIPEGEYTITVLNKFGCGEEKSTSIVVADFPKFFTPNGDGYHDTWNIKGTKALDNVVIYIFDRYGKLLKEIDPNGIGWDGTFSGNPSPSTDYWFKLIYTKDNVTKEFSSHFALKR